MEIPIGAQSGGTNANVSVPTGGGGWGGACHVEEARLALPNPSIGTS